MKHVILSYFLTLFCMLSAQAALVTRGPYLQAAGSDRVTICWRSDVPTTNELSYGLNKEGPFTLITKLGLDVDHAISIIGLQPGTRYYYRIKGLSVVGASLDLGGDQFWFKTAPVDGSSTATRIWAVGDSGYQTNYADLAYAAYNSYNQVTSKTTDVFLMLGDNAYPNGTDSTYQGALFNRYASLIKNTPLWSTIGNHDDTTVPANPVAPYFSIFNFPTAGECGGFPSGTEKYFSFNHGNIHFISIDTNTYASVADAPGAPYGMVDWLRDDLIACSADWIIAFMHQAPYSKGSHNSDTELNLVLTRNHIIPLLENYGVDLVIGGHSHSYERSALIDGHYGISNTYDSSSMRKWPGNGSCIGGLDSFGSFQINPATANGAYQKLAATGRAGAVYVVSGASSSVQNWWSGSANFVNPLPHPAHEVSLLSLGSLVIDIDKHMLNARYLNQVGNIQDDFTILKGSTYTLQPAVPTVEQGMQGVAFAVTRSGATAFSESVPVHVRFISGNGSPPSNGIASFTPGQESALVKFFPQFGSSSIRFEVELQPSTRSVQPGAVARSQYRISGDTQFGQFGATPASSWYASRFGYEPNSSEVWTIDDDGDGLSLLLEYALGGEPNRNDADKLPMVSIEEGVFVFRYTRPHGRTDLGYQVYCSCDLESWVYQGLSDVSDGPNTHFGEPRRVGLPMDSGIKFARLKIDLSE